MARIKPSRAGTQVMTSESQKATEKSFVGDEEANPGVAKTNR